VAWLETGSQHFTARHDDADAAGAAWVLRQLEDTRARLAERFPTLPGDDLAIVLHGTVAQLHAAQPLLPVELRLSAPAARRYVVGRAARREIHMLSPRLLSDRASQLAESKDMLRLTPAALYTRLVVMTLNPALRGPRGVRWLWLSAGAGEFFAGRVRFVRPAIRRRLHEGVPPSFPPAPRDALLLGGTVVDLLAREQGEAAALSLVLRAGSRGGPGPAGALVDAFDGRQLRHTEGTWRAHLARTAGRPDR
jgi:hypothetical protein